MINMDFITLEDGLEYAIVDEIIIDGIKYLYLVDENSSKIELRKLNNAEDLIKVENKEEYNKALALFVKNHKNDLA